VNSEKIGAMIGESREMGRQAIEQDLTDGIQIGRVELVAGKFWGGVNR
jgi:hypothetical protein